MTNQPTPYPLGGPSIKSMSPQFRDRDVMQNCVYFFVQVQVDDISFSSLTQFYQGFSFLNMISACSDNLPVFSPGCISFLSLSVGFLFLHDFVQELLVHPCRPPGVIVLLLLSLNINQHSWVPMPSRGFHGNLPGSSLKRPKSALPRSGVVMMCTLLVALVILDSTIS